jgi:DNA-binding NtrC family response regulator
MRAQQITTLSVHRTFANIGSIRALSGSGADFDSLLHECLEEVCQELGRKVLRLTEDAAHALETYAWPEGVAELRSVLEHAVLSCAGAKISVLDLPLWLGESRDNLALAESLLLLDLQKAMSRSQYGLLAETV